MSLEKVPSPDPNAAEARIEALEARARTLEEMAFSYAVLAEISRAMNTFLIAEEMISFALEIMIECAGFTKGMMLVYNRTQEVLTIKSCKLFTQRAPGKLEAIACDDFLNMRFRADVDSVRELELSGSYVFVLEQLPQDAVIRRAFPGLLESFESAFFDITLLFVHRGELKGMVLLGERIGGSLFQVEGNLRILSLADLTATCLANIHFRELAIIDDLTKVYTWVFVKKKIPVLLR